eukprot:scaffold907_cov55-Attheya_sp.AAC.5
MQNVLSDFNYRFRYIAMGRECVAVALSPTPYFQLGKTYVVHFGASGNLSTVLRRRLPNGHEAIDASFPCRVCSDSRWIPYWIYLDNLGNLSVGLGRTIGDQCIGTLDDSLYQQLRSGVDAARHVGIGNSALGRNARDLRVRNIHISSPSSHTPEISVVPNETGFMTIDNLFGGDSGNSRKDDVVLLKEYEAECAKARARAVKFGIPYKDPPPDAFFKWSEARRTDPPQKLWADGTTTITEKQEDDSKMDGFDDAKTSAVLIPEKIHLFGIDWAAFKQIRTEDVMAYFSAYGPSYVEWLGELSCNILFEDKYSAARAMKALSEELPSPPPFEESMTDLDATNPVEAPEEVETTDTTKPDLGNMGWRMCHHALRKVAHDRYGRRGTTCRVLFRIATSLDVLEDRPTSWPAPPPGFTTKRILGPGSDFDTGPRGKKRHKGHRNSGGFDEDMSMVPDGEHPALSTGLKASRAGFSMEELEAERAAKRAAAAGEVTPITENTEASQ